VTKQVGEEYLRVYHHVYGLETVTLRYFNVYGARQAADSEYSAVIPIFLTRLFRGERPIIYGDGLQSRDFTYIDNVVDANLLAAEAPADQVAGMVMNAACGGAVTVKDLCLKLIEYCGLDVEPEYADPRPGDILHSHADISLARERMGYGPQVDFETGLRRTYEWYVSQQKQGDTVAAQRGAA
jgi:UDP-glucose 4-epimerase